jgi:hypothetical protein
MDPVGVVVHDNLALASRLRLTPASAASMAEQRRPMGFNDVVAVTVRGGGMMCHALLRAEGPAVFLAQGVPWAERTAAPSGPQTADVCHVSTAGGQMRPVDGGVLNSICCLLSREWY